MKKGKTPFCTKNGSHAFIDIQNLMHKFRGGSNFDELSSFYSKSEILFVLSSITKKWVIESAYRPLIDFSN
jgi:hypothetical protein